jgi:hypothetical protein
LNEPSKKPDSNSAFFAKSRMARATRAFLNKTIFASPDRFRRFAAQPCWAGGAAKRVYHLRTLVRKKIGYIPMR